MCLCGLGMYCWFYGAVYYSERVADWFAIWRWNSAWASLFVHLLAQLILRLFEWAIKIVIVNVGLEGLNGCLNATKFSVCPCCHEPD